jgi:hypothetical protein
LTGANLTGANLEGTNLTDAILDDTILQGTNLNEAIIFETPVNILQKEDYSEQAPSLAEQMSALTLFNPGFAV